MSVCNIKYNRVKSESNGSYEVLDRNGNKSLLFKDILNKLEEVVKEESFTIPSKVQETLDKLELNSKVIDDLALAYYSTLDVFIDNNPGLSRLNTVFIGKEAVSELNTESALSLLGLNQGKLYKAGDGFDPGFSPAQLSDKLSKIYYDRVIDGDDSDTVLADIIAQPNTVYKEVYKDKENNSVGIFYTKEEYDQGKLYFKGLQVFESKAKNSEDAINTATQSIIADGFTASRLEIDSVTQRNMSRNINIPKVNQLSDTFISNITNTKKLYGDNVLMSTVGVFLDTTITPEIDESLSPTQKDVIKLAAKYISDMTFVSADNAAIEHEDGNKRPLVGVYNYSSSNKGYVVIDSNHLNTHVVTHELLHALTSRFIDDNSDDPDVRDLINIYNKALDAIHSNPNLTKEMKDNFFIQYGISNVHEFIAEIFSNSDFAAFIDSIPYKNSGDSFLHKLLQQLKKLLGFKNDIVPHTVYLTENIINKYGKQLKDGTFNQTDTTSRELMISRHMKNSPNTAAPNNLVAAMTNSAQSTANAPYQPSTQVLLNANNKKAKFSNQLVSANQVQKEVVDRLSLMSGMKKDTLDGQYELMDNQGYVNRVSSVLSRQPEFSFENNSIEDAFELNAEWGNQLDDIISFVLEDSNNNADFNKVKQHVLDNIADRNVDNKFKLLLSDKVLREVIDMALRLKSNYPNSVFLTQMFLYNKEAGIGGTADIIIVQPDGSLSVIDIKSSINPINWNGNFFEEISAKKEVKNGQIVDSSFTYAYDKRFKLKGIIKGSKKDKHEAQGSMYIGMLKHGQFIINKNTPFNVANIFIKDISQDNTILDAELEFNTYPNNGKGIKVNDKYVSITNTSNKHFDLNLNVESYKDDLSLVTDHLRKAVNKQIRLLNKQSSNIDNSFAIRTYKQYLSSLTEINEANAIENYISILHTTFVDNDRFNTELDNIREQLRAGKFDKDPLEGIRLINYYKQQFQLSRPILNTIKKLYNKIYLTQGFNINEAVINPLSPLYKINQINEVYTTIEQDLENKVNTNLSILLARQLDTDSTKAKELEKQFKDLKTIADGLRNVSLDSLQGLKAVDKSLQSRAIRLVEKLSNEMNKGNLDILTTNKFYAKERAKLLKQLDDKIKTYEEKLIVSEETIYNMLNENSFNNISVLGEWLVTAASSSNPLIALFVKQVKEALESSRVSNMKTMHNSHKAYQEFKESTNSSVTSNVDTINEGLYETIKVYDPSTGGLTDRLALVQETDISTYNANLNAQIELVKTKTNDSKKRGDLMQDWYSKNMQALPFESQTVTDAEGNKVIIKKGIKDILAEKKDLYTKGIIDKYTYDSWIRKAIIKTPSGLKPNPRYSEGRELMQPSLNLYSNANFKKLGLDMNNLDGTKNNTAKGKFYTHLLSLYFSKQNKMPARRVYNNKFILPSDQKNSKDMFAEYFAKKGLGGALSYVKFKGKEFTQGVVSDESIYGHEGLSSVPAYYNRPMPIEEVSLDLISSITKYALAADNYDIKLKMSDVGEVLYDKVLNSTAFKTTAGTSQISSLKKALGLKTDTASKVEANANRVASLLRSFIDMQLYGKMQNPNKMVVKGKEVDLNKIVSFFQSSLAITSLGGIQGALTSMSNYIQGSTVNLIESTAKQYYSTKGLASAKKEYTKLELRGDFIKDRKSSVNKTLIGQLVDLYDAMQGNFVDKFGNKISQSNFKRAFSQDTWFALHNMQEHRVQVTSMIAMLKDTKVKTKSGSEVSLYEAYELGEDGFIKVKDDIDLTSLGRLDNSKLLPLQVQGRLHGINRSLHGNYARFNATKASSTLLGRSFEFYRKYLVTGLMKRFEQTRYDHEIEDTVEGYYRTFLGHLRTDLLDMMSIAYGIRKKPDGSYYTDLEIANVKRASIELAIIGLLMTAGMILKEGLKDADDEDKRKYLMPLYAVLRLKSEMLVYLPMSEDTRRVVKNPFIGYSYINKVTDLIDQTFTDMYGITLGDGIQRYKRDTGIWEKGDSKWVAKIVKLFGMQGSKFDLEEAIKVLELSKL